MKTIQDIKILKGTKVLMRVDFNVPVQNGVVVDDFRIRKMLPTLAYLREKGARVIMVSHIESGEKSLKALSGSSEGEPSLAPVAAHLKKMDVTCAFVQNYASAYAISQSMKDGDVILLENLRINEGEKKNDPLFAKFLASLANVYINEAFPVSHRAHASIVAVTEFLPSYAGFVFEDEVKHLSAAFHPKHPFLFLLGGAKFETKVPLIEKFMDSADFVFVGGALAHNFFKEKGWNLGKSLVSPADFNLKRFFSSSKLLLPIDVVTIDANDIKGGTTKNFSIKSPEEVSDNDVIVDAGPKTLELLKKIISGNVAQIIWNGPLGAYEQGFKQPTIDLASAIAESTRVHATNTIVGGADTLATIEEIKETTGKALETEFSFVSTGGGAMLDFLANETLPGIEALEKSSQ